MSNIHGLNSLKKNQPTQHSSDSEGDEDRQGFYVGGSDHSGQQVLGPNSGEDLARRLFDAARSAGAEQISQDVVDSEAAARTSGSSSVFQGGAYRLGGHGQQSQSIESARTTSQEPADRPVIVNLNVWQNGFSIDDEPLRDMAAPENRSFLEDISQGRIPSELSQTHRGRRIDLHMIRKNTSYVPPKAKPFGGTGHRLGGVTPNVIGESAEVVELDKPSEQELKELREKAQESVGIRSEVPTTRVQVRLPGVQQPLVGTFNVDHTITDLRTFIVNAQPNLAFQPFQLLSAYPIKTLEDEKSTLKDAGVANAVVNVKYI